MLYFVFKTYDRKLPWPSWVNIFFTCSSQKAQSNGGAVAEPQEEAIVPEEIVPHHQQPPSQVKAEKIAEVVWVFCLLQHTDHNMMSAGHLGFMCRCAQVVFV